MRESSDRSLTTSATEVMAIRFISVLVILLATAAILPAGDNIFDKRFEAQQKNALKELERRLTQSRGSEEETWYVIAFHDQAAQAEFRRYSPTARSGYWSYDVKRANSIKKVQGRKAAAEAVYQFLVRSSESLTDLPPSAFDNLVRWQKAWDYRAFRSAKEANAFYLSQQKPAEFKSR